MDEEYWKNLTEKVETMSNKAMKVLLSITLPILALAIAYAYGYQKGSGKVPEKETKIEYVDRVVEKEVKVYVQQKTKENTKKTITKPDGTVVVVEKEINSETKIDQTEKEKQKETIVTVDKKDSSKQWKASVMIGTEISDWKNPSPVFGSSLDYKIFSSSGAGLWYLHTNEKLIGTSLFVEF